MSKTDLPFLPTTPAEAPEVRGSELRSTAWLGVSVSVNDIKMTEATVGVPALANGCPPLCEGCGEPKLYRGREATSLMCCSACWQRLPKWMREASINGGGMLWENRIAVTLLWMREASSPNSSGETRRGE